LEQQVQNLTRDFADGSKEKFPMKHFMCFLGLATLLALGTTLALARSTPQLASVTVENLQTAFDGESNAHARYVAFAEQADKEGYFQIASLFRAAAQAEEIHAKNHADEIKVLGGKPQASIQKPATKTTKENLEAAIKGETYERDVMYPEFYKQARNAGIAGAVQTINYASAAEAEHAKLFTAALNNMATMRAKGVTYYVCTICGYTTTNLDFAKCHTCFSPKEKYVAVT
jgi:rubrerythrin